MSDRIREGVLSSSVAKDQNEEPLVLTAEQEQEARHTLMRVLSWDRPGLLLT